VVGARPQFIKAAAVSRPLRQRHQEILLHTGQHYDEAMSDRFFKELDLPQPEIELGIGSGTHAQQTGRMLIGIEAAIGEQRPDAVLVYGDTNSTIAGALAAAKMHVPVAHVEAGLRSFNRAMPEEINRVVTDALSSLLLCPSETAAMNLRREGITSGVHVVGDVMADVLAKFGGTANAAAVLADCGVRDGQYFVATMHRAENTDDLSRLSSIIGALADLPLPVVFPAHPRVKNAIESAGLRPRPNLIVIDPLGYASMIALATHARAVLTDSGGLQKEAYWLGVPCVTLRDQTEWVETVASGWNTLAGADRSRILAAVEGIDARASRPPLYGEGNATAQIIEALSCLAASSKGSS
jgi:UDP-GlcNAc3NAcA epimerase